MKKRRSQIKNHYNPIAVKILPPYYMLLGLIQFFGPSPFNILNGIIGIVVGYFGLGGMKKLGLYGALILSLFAILDLVRNFRTPIDLPYVIGFIILLPVILVTPYVFYRYRDLYK